VNFHLNMSAGEFFDLIRPAVLLVSAALSTWVLASARKRFPFYQALLWALGTLFFPLIILPLYFVALLVKKRKIAATVPSSGDHSHSSASPIKWRFAATALYALIVFSSIGIYLYRDHESVDAHLARAVRARLDGDRTRTIREYKQALALEDDPHTHKLLAVELADLGSLTDAISEFRLALHGGEPDDSIHFRLGSLLDQIGHKDEASLEYEEFLKSKTCTREPADFRCEAARQRVSKDKSSAGLE
jgi:tetratricopeptide (TPR) repeat protein